MWKLRTEGHSSHDKSVLEASYKGLNRVNGSEHPTKDYTPLFCIIEPSLIIF